MPLPGLALGAQQPYARGNPAYAQPFYHPSQQVMVVPQHGDDPYAFPGGAHAAQLPTPVFGMPMTGGQQFPPPAGGMHRMFYVRVSFLFRFTFL